MPRALRLRAPRQATPRPLRNRGVGAVDDGCVHRARLHGRERQPHAAGRHQLGLQRGPDAGAGQVLLGVDAGGHASRIADGDAAHASASSRPLMDVHVDGRSSGTTTTSWFDASSTREPGRTRAPSWSIWLIVGADEHVHRRAGLHLSHERVGRAEVQDDAGCDRALRTRGRLRCSTSLRLEAADTSTSSGRPCRASAGQKAQRARSRAIVDFGRFKSIPRSILTDS